MAGAILVLGAAAVSLPIVDGAARADDVRPALYVFLQLDIKSSALEQVLRRGSPELQVTVFGRVRDFQDRVASERPDAILTVAPLLELDHGKPTLQGQKAGREWEPLVLITITTGGKEVGSLSGKTVGVVDLLGRERTQSFVASVLATPDVKVKRVAKVEDLLPLLEFNAADGILIPASLVSRFTERTRLPLAVKELQGARLGLPAVAVRNPAARESIVKSMQRLDSTTRSLLGIDNWTSR